MSSSFLIGVWASGFWQELGSPASLSALTLSGYACTPETIGRLNNLIGTCYFPSGASGDSGIIGYNFDVAPNLTLQEVALIGAMYLVSYYMGLAQASMGAGGIIAITNGGTPVQSIKEGDSQITWANVAGIGRNYVELAKQAKLDLNYLVNAYINNTQGGNTPRSIAYLNALYPLVGGGYGGYGA